MRKKRWKEITFFIKKLSNKKYLDTFSSQSQQNKKIKKVLIVEKRSHIGGNCYTENIENINIHKYGPHIFHTNDEGIWQWINQFVEFNNYRHSPRVFYKNKMYSFPINLMT